MGERNVGVPTIAALRPLPRLYSGARRGGQAADNTDEIWSARTPVTPEPRGGGCPPPPVGRTRPVASFLKRRSRTGGTAVQKIWHICLCFPRTKPLAPKALSQTSPPQDGFAVANLGHPRKPSGLKARFTSALNSMQEYHELFRKLSGNEGFHSVQSPSSRDANDQHPDGRAPG